MFSQLSIHQEELRKYSDLGILSQEDYDELNAFIKLDDPPAIKGELQKTVFGYHPYWGGSNYLNYQWDLLSDLCYFSYEVDPESGNAESYHDWFTSPAIDSAFANDTRVHLCVTLFSGQSIFFNNPVSRQTLTNNLISMVRQRGAHGVSFDFEAVPASQGENMVNYVAEFAAVFRDSIADGILSIAMPAVDWSGIFDVLELNNYIDLYMIMGYDYYWNGSSQAGPVDPHYSMTSDYNYSVARTVSYYQSEGMPLDRMLLGVPYYAREWPTASSTPPSATTGWGDAYTWAKIRNNTSGNYSLANKHIEANSFGPYYAYYGSGWHQCFVNDERSLERRYKMVNRRGLAGIGIWALGYDNGHTDLWEVINENFAQGTLISWFDTIYDSGGPSWYYYDNEEYTMLFHGESNKSMRLEFSSFSLETGYDSLWVYSGPYPGGTLLGGYTGNSIPPVLYSGDMLSLRFRSDEASSATGWIANLESVMTSVQEVPPENIVMKLYPNPASSSITIESSINGRIQLYSFEGKQLVENDIYGGQHKMDISNLPNGIYLLVISNSEQKIQKKLLKY